MLNELSDTLVGSAACFPLQMLVYSCLEPSPGEEKKEKHSAKPYWIPFSGRLTNANFIRRIKSWRMQSGKSYVKWIFRKKTKFCGMYTSVLVKYLHVALWCQQLIRCSRDTHGWFVWICGSGTLLPLVIIGKFTFSFSFLWLIRTEGCFGTRPWSVSEDLAGFLKFSCQWSTSTTCRSGGHSCFCAGLSLHLNPPFLAFFCASTKPELSILLTFLSCLSFVSQCFLLHCALMLFLYPDQEIGF